MGFDVVLPKRWMRDINRRYQIDHDSNEMWIGDNLWEETEDGHVHYLPGLCPLDVDQGIVEQANFMSIHIIRKAELENVSACLLEWAVLIKVQHRSNGGTLQTDKLRGEFQVMLTEFQCLFGEQTFANLPNGRQADFEITTVPNGEVLFGSPYRIFPQEEADHRKQMGKAICSGWIQPSRSNFGSPVVFVPKPDSTPRLCIDHREVNAITVDVRYPLLHIEDLVNCIHSSCWFTQLDLAAGYHQICITTADRQKTAFTTKFGCYEWRILLFGLANAPSHFMLIMNCILEPINGEFVVVYQDYIMIRSGTLAEHVIHIREVFTLLHAHGLKAKRAKCSWAGQKVNFCGFEIDKDGIHAQEHETRALTDWPQPQNNKDAGGFLGLTSYYSKFIDLYTHIAMRLYAIGTPPKGKVDMRRRHGEPSRVSHTPFAPDRESKHAFDRLKKALCNAPVLALPDPEA